MIKILDYYKIKHYKYNNKTNVLIINQSMPVKTFVSLRRDLYNLTKYGFKLNNIIVRGR